jgi:Exopolysaccharide synthesis, ExoD
MNNEDPEQTLWSASCLSAEMLPSRLSADLDALRVESAGKPLTVEELQAALKGRGVAMLLLLLLLPFCFIPVPGLSTPFGVAVLLMGIRIALGQKPWLPRLASQRSISPSRLVKVLTGCRSSLRSPTPRSKSAGLPRKSVAGSISTPPILSTGEGYRTKRQVGEKRNGIAPCSMAPIARKPSEYYSTLTRRDGPCRARIKLRSILRMPGIETITGQIVANSLPLFARCGMPGASPWKLPINYSASRNMPG